MVDNPLLVLLIAAGLFIFFLAVFAFFTYLILRLAVDFKRKAMGKK